MDLKKYFLFVLFTISSHHIVAQQIYVYDNDRNPVANAELMYRNTTISFSDTNGLLRFDKYSLKGTDSVTIYKVGYKVLTIPIKELSRLVYLETLQNELNEIVVTIKQSKLFMQSYTEDIIDYIFMGDNYLVASYNLNGRRKDKISILDKNGKIIIRSIVPVNIEKLFLSCIGKYYVVSYNCIYQLDFETNPKEIRLGKALSLDEYNAIQSCVLFRNNTYYYKYSNPRTFNVAFAKAGIEDTSIYTFCNLSKPETFNASVDNLKEIYKLLAKGDDESRRRATQLSFLRKMLDKLCFKDINAELFENDSSLLIFDFNKRVIRYYTHNGEETTSIPILFLKDQEQNHKYSIIQDNSNYQFYLLLTEGHKSVLTKINTFTGNITGPSVTLEKKIVENVKVKNGKVFYLHKSDALIPYQLFTERI